MQSERFEIQCTWDGAVLGASEFARIDVRMSSDLHLSIEASYHGDPAPDVPPGMTEALWNYEVVEIFLVGARERYLEVELGPHGHHLGLVLAGRRNVVERGIPIEYSVERSGSRWRGEARLSLKWLPADIRSANAYSIHGNGLSRRYLAAHPVPGSAPDFHRLEHFAPTSLAR
jgi:hypothetical protein